ncbi:MAG: YlxR family protein [Deltaproteobacteria bacterium]|nr:YlxR family protein [Deltaproteobacteria bacterium]MBW2216894.1 YlxR family protein [Deltaproteobacteria bacterium]
MVKLKTAAPIRTCISCRTKKDKKKLIRLVLDVHGFVVRDDRGGGKGRGAYVCPDKSCWENLKKGNRLNRAFRKEGSIAFHPGLGLE